MNNANAQRRNRFSAWQLTTLPVIAGMGGMYFYPQDFTRSSFLLMAAAGILAIFSMAMLGYSFVHSKSKAFPNMLEENLGLILSRIVLVAASVYFIAEICTVTIRQTQMTGLFLLEKTPPQVIAAVLLLTGAFIMYSGIRQISRTAELLFFLIMIPLFIILLLALFCIDYGELRLLIKPVPITSGNQLREALLPLGGIAAMAYFVGYYDKSKRIKGLAGGTLILSIFALAVLLCCVGVFSLGGTAHLSFPLAELSRIVSLGSLAVTERFDILYMIIYTSATILSVGILYYCSCISLCGVFGISSHKCFIFILLPIIFLISYYGLYNEQLINSIAVWGRVLFLFLLIPILFVITIVKGRLTE